MRLGNLIRWAIAIALVALSLINASWIAPDPKGALTLIAAKPGSDEGCVSLEGTRRALIEAGGPAVLDLEARPGCLPAAQAIEQFPRYHFIVRTNDPTNALALLGTLKAPVDERVSFLGDEKTVAAVRAKAPQVGAWSIAGARACFADYVKLGWIGVTPSSCSNGTILVPLDQKWKLAGWPKRFQSRMAKANTRVILTAPGEAADTIPGLTELEQIPEVPRAYTGFLWVDDAALIGPSIRR